MHEAQYFKVVEIEAYSFKHKTRENTNRQHPFYKAVFLLHKS